MMLRLAMVLTVLLGMGATLGACHTVAGVGQDVSSAGHAVTGAADKATQ